MDAYCFKHSHSRIYIWSCSNHSHKCYDRKIYRIPLAGFIGFLVVEGTVCKKMVQHGEMTGAVLHVLFSMRHPPGSMLAGSLRASSERHHPLNVRFIARYMVGALQSPGTIIRRMIYNGSVESRLVDNWKAAFMLCFFS